MEDVEQKIPNKIWYVGHFFLGVISGLICYVIWRDQNPQMAKRHLLVGLILTLSPAIIAATFVITVLPLSILG